MVRKHTDPENARPVLSASLTFRVSPRARLMRGVLQGGGAEAHIHHPEVIHHGEDERPYAGRDAPTLWMMNAERKIPVKMLTAPRTSSTSRCEEAFAAFVGLFRRLGGHVHQGNKWRSTQSAASEIPDARKSGSQTWAGPYPVASRMECTPARRAHSTSDDLSPIITERARSMPNSAAASSSMPGAGLRRGDGTSGLSAQTYAASTRLTDEALPTPIWRINSRCTSRYWATVKNPRAMPL